MKEAVKRDEQMAKYFVGKESSSTRRCYGVLVSLALANDLGHPEGHDLAEYNEAGAEYQ